MKKNKKQEKNLKNDVTDLKEEITFENDPPQEDKEFEKKALEEVIKC